MFDVGYIFSLAFSGADLSRALWFGLIGSLLCSSKHPPLHLAIAAFAIDRVWPFIGMALSGHDVSAVSASVGHQLAIVPSEALALLLRFLGLYALIAGGYALRLMAHGQRVETKPAKAKR